jgi:hypothetical protein
MCAYLLDHPPDDNLNRNNTNPTDYKNEPFLPAIIKRSPPKPALRLSSSIAAPLPQAKGTAAVSPAPLLDLDKHEGAHSICRGTHNGVGQEFGSSFNPLSV